MSTATIIVGPGESYRNKKTGRVTTLGPNEQAIPMRAEHYEKIHTGGVVSGTINFGKVSIGDLHVGNHGATIVDLDDWESPGHAFYIPGGPKTDIPAFVEPERPAEPKPEPDSPAVAVLRRLLEDREARVEDYKASIEDLDERIKELETQLQAARDDRDHKDRCRTAAINEGAEIVTNIVALGGSV